MLREYGYYDIRAFEKCPYFYDNFKRHTRTRRPIESLIRSVVGDEVHKVVEDRHPQKGDPLALASGRIEKRLPVEVHKEAKIRAKRQLRRARQVIDLHPGKSPIKTFRWTDDGPGGLGCLFYSTPDRNRVLNNTWTIVEVKGGDERNPNVRKLLKEHLRFHAIVAASSFAAIGERPKLHLVGYALEEEDNGKGLVQISSSGDRDLSLLEPTVEFWYCWDFLEGEQEELRERVRPVKEADDAGEYPADPNDDCHRCDYIWTADCGPGQERAQLLETAKERRPTGRVTLGDVMQQKPPKSEGGGINNERKQA
jgi:hypothetical protein